MDLIDPHVHLDAPAYDRDRGEVLERARAAGIRRFIVPALGSKTFPRLLALAEAHPDVWVAVGIYPRSCEDWKPDDIRRLREAARHPRVVAIGEIGLDYSPNNRCIPKLQATAFAAQLELAAELGLPVMVHFWTTRSYEDSLRLIGRSSVAGRERAGVLEHFAADERLARRALDLGLYIGLAGRITYATARRLPAVVAALPLDRVLIQSDAPALPPEGYRKVRNEPGYLPLIARALARIHGMRVEEVARITTRNAMRLFWPTEATEVA